MKKSIDDLIEKIIFQAETTSRLIVSISGPPGSGKSTLSTTLCDELNRIVGANSTVEMPMDGYHLDNDILKARDLLDKKGSPPTFDVDGLSHDLSRVMAQDRDVVIPIFDRVSDRSIAGARVVERQHRIILLEGNYLLLKGGAWGGLKKYYGLSIFLEVPLDVLRVRLINRWLEHGFSHDEAEKKALSNDVPNAEFTIQNSVPADILYV
ncbi:AAA family ATPase [Kiloniella sp.]|uniref:AAA family ATPase n=1 Tax=Kiloniella sp. TaxID=1938587 RepID=UPI003B016026